MLSENALTHREKEEGAVIQEVFQEGTDSQPALACPFPLSNITPLNTHKAVQLLSDHSEVSLLYPGADPWVCCFENSLAVTSQASSRRAAFHGLTKGNPVFKTGTQGLTLLMELVMFPRLIPKKQNTYGALMQGQSQGFKRKRRNSLGRGLCSRPIRTTLLALLSTSQANPPNPSLPKCTDSASWFWKIKRRVKE